MRHVLVFVGAGAIALSSLVAANSQTADVLTWATFATTAADMTVMVACFLVYTESGEEAFVMTNDFHSHIQVHFFHVGLTQTSYFKKRNRNARVADPSPGGPQCFHTCFVALLC